MSIKPLKKVAYLVNRITNTSIPCRLEGTHKNVKIEIFDSYWQLIKKISSFDIVHSHHTRSALALSLLYICGIYKNKITFFHTMHRDFNSMSSLKRFVYVHFILKRRDGIICNSKNTKKSVQKYVNKNLYVVYNGVDEERFFPRQKKSIDTKSVKIITASRLIASKRVDILLFAFSEFQRSITQNSILTIIGDGPEKSKLTSLAKSLKCKNVQFLGNIEHNKIADYLRKSDIFVTCSETEGFGVSTIEAYYCGLNIVASDIDIHFELGEKEFNFFALNDKKSLIETLTDVAKIKCQGAYQNNLKVFSLCYTTSQLVAIYND